MVMAQKIVNDISEGFLQCSICMERYDALNRTPKMLPCTHSFCLPCLEQLEVGLQRDGKLFSCPLCREPTVLPSSGVKDLPVNFLLVSLMESLKMVDTSGHTSSNCIFCRDEKDIQFCIDCKFHICPSCKKAHDKMPGTLDHALIPVEKLSDERYMKQVLATQTPRCDKHIEDKLQYYCLPCCQLVCRQCMFLAHQGHKCAEAKSQVNGVKEKLTNSLEASRAKVHAASDIDARLDKSKQKVELNIQNVMKHVNLHFNQLVNSLTNDRDQLLRELQQKPSDVKTVSEEVKNWLRAMSNTEEVTEKILEGNNQWEILGMEKDLSDAFTKLCESEESLQRKSFDIQQASHGLWRFAQKIPWDGLGMDCRIPNVNKLGELVFEKSKSAVRHMNPDVAEFWPKKEATQNYTSKTLHRHSSST